jgi:hypothetical protein
MSYHYDLKPIPDNLRDEARAFMLAESEAYRREREIKDVQSQWIEDKTAELRAEVKRASDLLEQARKWASKDHAEYIAAAEHAHRLRTLERRRFFALNSELKFGSTWMAGFAWEAQLSQQPAVLLKQAEGGDGWLAYVFHNGESQMVRAGVTRVEATRTVLLAYYNHLIDAHNKVEEVA